jgi:hypothetical protein
LKIIDATATPVNRPTGVHLSNNDYFSVAPSSTYGVGTGFIVSVWARFGNLQNISSTILSHMAIVPYQGDASAQSLQIGFNKNNNFGFSVYNFGGFSGPGPRSQTVGGGGAIDFTPQPGWHHFLFRVTQWNEGVQGNPYTTNNNTEFWIDGVKVGDNGGAGPNGGLNAYFANPSYVGAAQIAARFENQTQTIYTNTLIAGASLPTVGPGIYAVNEQDIDIRQLWIGEANTTQFNINKFYNNGYVDMGASGVSSGLPTPKIYNIFDLPAYQAGIFTPRTYGNLTVNSLATGNTLVANAFYPPGVTQTIYSEDYYPYDYVPGGHIPLDLPLVATFTAIGDNIVEGTANVDAVISLSALGNYAEFGNAVLSSTTAVVFNAYDFTKAAAVINSNATLTLQPGNALRNVSVNMQTAMSATMVAKPTLAGDIDLASEFTLSVEATTNLLGIASVQANFTLAAQTYDFTKASAVINASALLQSEGRIQARTRGIVEMQSAFSLSAQTLRIRTNSLQASAQASVLTGVGGALRGGNTTMLAFDTVLSAGKIIEFLVENTIAVTEEQRRLRVALESTVLLVQMANGVNTITAETTDIVVPQEQGRLLAQHNLPTN